MPSSISNPKDTFSNSGVLIHHRLPSRQQVCTTSLYISSNKKHLMSYTRSKRNAGRPRGRNWLTLLSLLVIFFILSDGVALHLFFLFFFLSFFSIIFFVSFFPCLPLIFFSDDAVDYTGDCWYLGLVTTRRTRWATVPMGPTWLVGGCSVKRTM
ncbi:hypothetical protein D6D13_08465 [Aureobasidium pullulans]|uniref:Transmembrane protein n=1 Tax=Aureobasidium pullulans TaxID=5580 RepID=A0A4S9C6L4_AURPU|nr:hypothetical protein D6D13_08465 [Aureobasidium pullulans]